jgi:hypothetical protein
MTSRRPLFAVIVASAIAFGLLWRRNRTRRAGVGLRSANFRSQLPRFYELKDLITDPSAPTPYFQGLEDRLQTPEWFAVFSAWEKQFQGLDNKAWELLKTEAVPYLDKKDPCRGWQQLYDILGQAHAYNHLKEVDGCMQIDFIPRSGKKTPDLEGSLDSGRVLCEVKTINVSVDAINARTTLEVCHITDKLDDAFFHKFDSDIMKAKSQLQTYDPAHEARWFVHVDVCFDEWNYRKAYLQQIDQHLKNNPPGVEVVVRDSTFV